MSFDIFSNFNYDSKVLAKVDKFFALIESLRLDMQKTIKRCNRFWVHDRDTRRRAGRAMLLAVTLIVSLPISAARIQGQVSCESGAALANTEIIVDGKKSNTDGAGVYSLDLSPGQHEITVRGQAVSVSVAPQGSRRDIRVRC